MDNAAVKELRVLLRQVQDHLLTADALAGVRQESVGMVDVVTHPTDDSPALNYVLPRRNTAWVPAPAIEAGLHRLHEQGRAPRFQYMEGLFPPQFSDTLAKVGLAATKTLPVYAYKPGFMPPAGVYLPPPVVRLRVEPVKGDRATNRWQRGRDWPRLIDARATATGDDRLQMFRFAANIDRVPSGFACIEVQREAGTAQIVTVALADGATGLHGLLNRLTRAALRHGGKLVFALADGTAATALQALGFTEIGQLKRFAAAPPQKAQDKIP